MNPIDDQLNRLFRAASQAGSDPVPTPPYGLEVRVMAAWRRASPSGFWDAGLLIRGLIAAILILGISLWPTLHNTATTNPFSDSLQLADSYTTAQIDNTP
jgi:hypothetical protein